MAKVKFKNKEQQKSAKNKLRGNVSFGKTKNGDVAKKWPVKKSKSLAKKIYKPNKEKVRTVLAKKEGARDNLLELDINTIGLKNVDNISSKKPYYKKGDFSLYNANSLDFLKSLPENSIDMIFADPPYFLSNGGFSLHAGKRVSVDKGQWDVSNGLKKDFDFHVNWIKECKRILKPNGTIWISGTYHSIYTCGFALKLAKYKILNDIAWYKPNGSPNLSCRYFTANHETLIWAIKDPRAKHTFNYNEMRNGDWKEDFIKKPNKQMRSVWAINTPQPWEKKFGKHPTQKPFNLLKRIVLASTNKGDIILDPFTGSSTTGLVANLNNRKFIGVDTEKGFLDLSIKRFEEIASNLKNNFQLI